MAVASILDRPVRPAVRDIARLKAEAKAVAKSNGHKLSKWEPDEGQPTAVCYCGAYVVIFGGLWETRSIRRPVANVFERCPGAPKFDLEADGDDDLLDVDLLDDEEDD